MKPNSLVAASLMVALAAVVAPNANAQTVARCGGFWTERLRINRTIA